MFEEAVGYPFQLAETPCASAGLGLERFPEA